MIRRMDADEQQQVNAAREARNLKMERLHSPWSPVIYWRCTVEPKVLRRIVCCVFGVLFTIGCALLVASPANAATAPVTNTLDAGPGSLRQAVLNAESDDAIVFDSAIFSVPLTITLTSGQIEISRSLSIDGSAGGVAMPTISGNGASRIFTITNTISVTLSSLHLVNGVSDPGGDGGGIFNRGTLTVNNITLSGNSGGSACNGGNGGGISNLGTLIVNNSTLSGNRGGLGSSTCNGGNGGGISNQGILSVNNSTLSGNSGGRGGDAYYWSYGGNGGNGGGIYNTGYLTITNSTLSGNNGGDGGVGWYRFPMPGLAGNGGGIYNLGTLTVNNNTLSGNSSGIGLFMNGYGGGIFNQGILILNNSTLSGNGLGGAFYSGSAITLSNTLIAFNDCQAVEGVIVDAGHNLDSADTCQFRAAGSLTNTNPVLGSLGYHGGQVMTIPLLPGSPAIGAGDPETCLATDAREMRRHLPVSCDIGAYEFYAPSVFFPLVMQSDHVIEVNVFLAYLPLVMQPAH
jgi:hypothetical protein